MTAASTDLRQLWQLMNAYFHQDFDLEGESEDEVLDAFARTQSAADVKTALGELDALLEGPRSGLLARFEAGTGADNLRIADDDAGAAAWLMHARDRLLSALSQGLPPTR